jgi:hypothetical protein
LPTTTDNSIAGSVKFSFYGFAGYPYAYSSGKNIGPAGLWFSKKSVRGNAVLAEQDVNNEIGKWNGLANEYLALRIKTGASYNYGWVRCSVTKGGGSITISGYAYETIADSSIIAGDSGTFTEVPSNQLQNVFVYSSGKNVYVKYPGAHDGITIDVRDMLGKEVKTIQTTNDLYKMNLANATSGIYIVTVRSKEAEITKKVSIL